MPFLKCILRKCLEMDIKIIIAALFMKQKLVTVLLFNNNETGLSTGIQFSVHI